MMSFSRPAFLATAAFALVSTLAVPQAPAPAQTARVGANAPDFKGTDSHGKPEALDQFRGKFVVLEWHNQECPFTRKHYESGNMQALQKQWTGKGVVWLTVISSAPGQQGYVTAEQENAYLAKMHAAPTAVLLDPDGRIGRLYDAKTTPDMYVINQQGVLIYEGAIDNKPTPDQADIQGAENFVNEALIQAMAGKAVATPFTRSYGCNVKYRN